MESTSTPGINDCGGRPRLKCPNLVASPPARKLDKQQCCSFLSVLNDVHLEEAAVGLIVGQPSPTASRQHNWMKRISPLLNGLGAKPKAG
ncbi:hypothetical protein [Deinococcus rubellus]|uniref:hypothetical protein n=1 Tax=Deinococcus rubellus TaxID=1889240 RepID=UPI0031EEBE72